MTGVLQVAGLSLVLEDTPAGPLLSTAGQDALPWVVNAALTGALPDLRERVHRREDAVTQGLSAHRRDGDAYVLSAAPAADTTVVGRVALLEVIDALAELRRGGARPGVDLDDLERRAAELDALEGEGAATADRAGVISAKRRVLLALLDEAGILSGATDPGPRALLRGYTEAAAELADYAASEDRRALVQDPQPAVSLDWFRRPSPRPNPLERPFRWTAFCESTFRSADLGDFAEGTVYASRGSGWWAVLWRRDDGVRPVIHAARPA